MIYVKEREERSVSEMLQNGQISNNRKTIRVVAAVIRRGNQIFASQRGYGDYKDWWEFPGGKIEAGETPEAALVREIREELDAEITVDEYIMTVEYDYPEFHLSMECYWCRLKNEHLTLLEHEASKWLRMDDLGQVNWLPADVLVVKAIGTKSNGSIQTAAGCEGKADRHLHFLNREERVAFYEQIYDGFRKLIINGVLESNEQLPSVRSLAVELSTNPNTVQKAYRILEQQGYIYTSPGRGTFVSDRKDTAASPAEIAEAEKYLKESINKLYLLGISKKEAKEMIEAAISERGNWK